MGNTYDLEAMRAVGARPGVIQIAAPRHAYRPVHRPIQIREDEDDHELVTRPLASPTGPHGAAGFRNKAGSQIAVPRVTNVYMGEFWGDRKFIEGFSKAIVEQGYLDPLKELGYGTGSGSYLGSVDGRALAANTRYSDVEAQKDIAALLDKGVLQADANTLFFLILPDKVTSLLEKDESCKKFCGYHDAFPHHGVEVAYAVMPSSLCKGCGGDIKDFTAVYAHELAEACTDKIPGEGWRAKDGQENGDLEAWLFFNWGPPEDPKRYNVQGYYTNERGNTLGAWRDP